MGRPIKLEASRDALDTQVMAAVSLFQALQAQTQRRSRKGLAKSYVDQCVGLAFMRMVAGWEDFLEDTIVKFKANASSALTPLPVVDAPLHTLDAARRNLMGTQPFLKLSYVSQIQNLSSRVFLSGDPYLLLTASQNQIENAMRVRNRIGHSSQKVVDEFASVAKWHLGVPSTGKLPKGYSPGRLLVSRPSVALFGSAVPSSPTVFEEYAGLYRALARLIVP